LQIENRIFQLAFELVKFTPTEELTSTEELTQEYKIEQQTEFVNTEYGLANAPTSYYDVLANYEEMYDEINLQYFVDDSYTVPSFLHQEL